jgi:hypothetical protein
VRFLDPAVQVRVGPHQAAVGRQLQVHQKSNQPVAGNQKGAIDQDDLGISALGQRDTRQGEDRGKGGEKIRREGPARSRRQADCHQVRKDTRRHAARRAEIDEKGRDRNRDGQGQPESRLACSA